jgi:hypothetical protein
MKRAMVLLAIVIIISVSNVNAQKSSSTYSSDYVTALGIKFYPTGVTLKHFLTGNKNAVEFLGYFYNDGTRLTGLYEIHNDINGAPGLRWYIGPGAHVSFYDKKKNDDHYGGAGIGVDGVLGLDYKIKSAPINLSLDWQPSFEFGDNFNNGFSGDWGGFAIRYTF